METSTLLVLGGMAIAMVFVVGSLMKAESAPAPVEEKKKKKEKVSKKEKIAARAAAQASSKATEKADAKEEEDKFRAEKKREKEREKKAAKKAAAKKAAVEKEAEEARAAAQAAAAAEKAAAESAAENDKKKKKKKKKKGKSEADKAAEEPAASAAAEAAPEEDDWEIVPTSKPKAKEVVVEVSADGEAAPVFSEEILIQDDQYSSVIGPKGIYLQKITEATNTKIDLPKKGTMRTMTIVTGGSKGDVMLARTALQQLMSKGYSELTHAGHVDEGVEVPPNKLGQLIGPGGQTIKLLQTKTNTKIDTPDRDSDSNFVTVVGDPANVKQCIEAIKQIIAQGFSSLTHEGWISKAIEVPKDQIGTVIGPAGATIKGLQSSTNTKINVPSAREDPVHVTIVGDAADVAAACAQIAAMLVPPEPEEIPYEWSKEAVEAMDVAF